MIRPLTNIRNKDVLLYGGKGASLGELIHLGCKVPAGFVISTDINDVNIYKTEIFAEFEKLKTQYVAVRSSANIEDGKQHSFAGQFKTYLFVEKPELVEKIAECKKSLDSSNITAYCKVNKIDKKQIKLAVVVQKMIQSQVAGVCFTINPVTNDNQETVIESCFGLGEALVGGKITPDKYIIKNLRISKEINTQVTQLVFDYENKKVSYADVNKSRQNVQKTDDTYLYELVKIAKKIEKHYGKPMDIEWAIEDKRLYILQARPITTIASPIKKHSMTINSDQYDHLWDWGAPNIISFMDQESFSQNGTIDFISHSVNKNVSLYISKIDRKKQSQIGFDTYYSNYEQYETETSKGLQEMKNILQKNTGVDFHLLSNEKLAGNFENFFKYIYLINRNYAVTECFSTDKVEDVLVRKDKKYDLNLLEKNIQKMGEFKLKQRDLMNKVWDYKKGILGLYLQEIKKRVKLDFSSEDYHYRELIDGLLGKVIPSINRSVWIRGKFSDWKFIVGDKANTLISSFSYVVTDTDIIHGTCSNQGKYTGIVRKIDFDIQTDYEKEIAQMHKGEILVSGSTGPELILACQKAGAIITEEGGVISHAAIISRELNIPCITGTHVAGKVLHTGDLVMVDADNGIVKILKKVLNTA